MLNNINIVLSYLDISDAKPYVKAWKGKLDKKEIEKIKNNIYNKELKKLQNSNKNLSTEELKDIANKYTEEYLNENLNYYTNKNNKSIDISNLYKDLFKGKYRIILPFTPDINTIIDNFKEDYYDNIKDKLENCLKLYFKYYNTKQNYEDWLFNPQQFIEGYIENKDNDKKKISLGKIFNEMLNNKKNIAEIEEIKNDIKKINTLYNKRPTEKRDLFIVISRHPYDIAGMSTDRGWTSCMNLKVGQFRQYVMSSIVNGALIAYVVNKNDLNIENPINRLLIKPYIKENENINFENPNFILVPSTIYGNNIDGFKETVEKWLNENWNNKLGYNNGIFELNKNFYLENEDYNIDLSTYGRKYKTNFYYDDVKNLILNSKDDNKLEKLNFYFKKCSNIIDCYFKVKQVRINLCKNIIRSSFNEIDGSEKEYITTYISNSDNILYSRFYCTYRIENVSLLEGCSFDNEFNNNSLSDIKKLLNSSIKNCQIRNVDYIDDVILWNAEIGDIKKIENSSIFFPVLNGNIEEINNSTIIGADFNRGFIRNINNSTIKIFDENRFDAFYIFKYCKNIKNSKLLFLKKLENAFGKNYVEELRKNTNNEILFELN